MLLFGNQFILELHKLEIDNIHISCQSDICGVLTKVSVINVLISCVSLGKSHIQGEREYLCFDICVGGMA